MKRLLLSIVPTLLLLVLSTSPAMAQTRIATVDLRKLFDGYWKTKQADAALKERFADLSKEGKSLQDDLKKANDEYKKLLEEANDQAVSSAERDKRKQAAEAKLKEIKDTQQTLNQFDRQMRSTLDQQKQRMREKILEEIKSTVAAKAKHDGFALVVDMAAETPNSTPVVLYSNGDNDLTDPVMAQLNAGAPPEEAKPADTKK